ncbi:MAG: hypothetical protein AB7G23_05900 [Vicinamibacterales bacterium]
MRHPIVLGLFGDPSGAARAARELRGAGVGHDRVSIVARNHDEEGRLAESADASPGADIEDSYRASRLGELAAHFISAIAVVLPGIGPIVADGPLAAGLAEAAGHLAGSVAGALERAGVPAEQATRWEQDVQEGHVIVAAHLRDEPASTEALRVLQAAGAADTATGSWPTAS